MRRKIVQIDQSKCDGCGLCVPTCAEGAIQIVNGKARLVSDVYCDGLGACLGHCPRDAIAVIQREAAAFDEAAVAARTAGTAHPVSSSSVRAPRPTSAAPTACPGAALRNLQLNLVPPLPQHPSEDSPAPAAPHPAKDTVTALANWPIQLHLVPPAAPFLRNAHLVLAADCVAFASPEFHGLLKGRPLLIGCPKLDDGQFYTAKLAQILSVAHIQSLTVLHMEVPCCLGLLRIAQAAWQEAGCAVPLEAVKIGIRGQTLSRTTL